MPLTRKARAAIAHAARPQPSPILLGFALVALSVALPASAADPREDGPTFEISRFAIEYGGGAVDLPEIASLIPVEVELARSETGWVDVTSARAGERQVLRIADGTNSGRYHASAVAAITRAVLERVRAEGFVGVFVKPHPADIDVHSERDLRPQQSGAVRLVVDIGRVRELRSVASGGRIGEDWKINNPSHRRIRVDSPIQPSSLVRAGTTDVIRKRELEDYLFRVNRYPGRRVEAALAGAKDGDGVALDFHVHEAKPWFAYFQSSDTGSARTAEWQHRFGFVHRQLTDNDDILSLQYTNAGGDRLHAVSASYDAPWFRATRPEWMKSQPDEAWWQRALLRDWIPWWGNDDIRWSLTGNYSTYIATDIGGIEDLEGTDYSANSRLTYQLFQYRDIFVDIFAGATASVVDVRSGSTDNEGSEFFLIPEIGVEVERIRETSTLTASADFETNISNTFQGDLNNLGRADVDEGWKVIHYSFGASFYLEPLLFPEDWEDPSTPRSSTLSHELSFGLRGQRSLGDRLPAQELQVIGGVYSVRGYDQSVASGDNVAVASAEYRFHLPRILPIQREPLRVPLLGDFRAAPQMVYGRPDWDLVLKGFIDYGRTTREQSQITGFLEESDTLLGGGVGVEFRYKHNLTVRADWGRALKDTKARDNAGIGPRIRKGEDQFHLLFTLLY